MPDLTSDDEATVNLITSTNGSEYPHRQGTSSNSKCEKMKRSLFTHIRKLFKTGCYVFLFFTLLKLVGLVILLTFGVRYLPISKWLDKAGLCERQNFKYVYINHTFENKTAVETICPTPVTPVCPVYNISNSVPNNRNNGDDDQLLRVFPGLKDAVDHQAPNYIPRLMCMVFTTPSAWALKAKAVNDTWVPRCDVHRFYYSGLPDALIPAQDAVPLGVPEGREHLTAKTMRALRSAYFDHLDEVDWFFKADDDSYVIVENLRWILSHFDPKKPHYIGGRSMDLLAHGYNGGGAGYALSKGAAQKIIEEGHLHPGKCKQDGGYEDLDIGACLEQFQIYPVDTKDLLNRLSFHPDHPYKIFARLGDNVRVYTYKKNGRDLGNPNGIRVMSPYMVSFHYMEPGHMYMYDFLLYELRRHSEFVDPQQDDKEKGSI